MSKRFLQNPAGSESTTNTQMAVSPNRHSISLDVENLNRFLWERDEIRRCMIYVLQVFLTMHGKCIVISTCLGAIDDEDVLGRKKDHVTHAPRHRHCLHGPSWRRISHSDPTTGSRTGGGGGRILESTVLSPSAHQHLHY